MYGIPIFLFFRMKCRNLQSSDGWIYVTSRLMMRCSCIFAKCFRKQSFIFLPAAIALPADVDKTFLIISFTFSIYFPSLQRNLWGCSGETTRAERIPLEPDAGN